MTPALTNALAALASRLTSSGDYEGVDVIDTATARIARLEEALGPWAEAARVVDMPGAAENTGDGKPFEDDEVLWAGETGVLTVADFRRARAALGSDAG